MEKSREESNVSLLRHTEISLPLSTAKNPNKRQRFPEDSSMAWCSFKNPKSVKARGCNDCDDFNRKPDSSQDFHLLEKHRQLETAIRGDNEFEKEECKKEKFSGELQKRITIGKKRSRCVYFPKNKASFEKLALHPELQEVPPSPFMMGNSSLKLSSSDEKISSISTKRDSSATDLEDQEREEKSQTTGDLKEKKLMLEKELNTLKFDKIPNVLPCGKTDIITESKRHDMNSSLNLSADLEDQNGDGVGIETGKNTCSVVEKLPLSAFDGNQLDHTSGYLVPGYIDPQDATNTALVDVHLTVKASCRVENVPYVCLTSQLNGKGILGHPLEIGELSYSSETLLSSYESACCKLFSDEGNSWPRLVWRTSKRTPVCYVTNSLFSSISKTVLPVGSRKNAKEKCLKKLPKNPSHFKQGRATLHRTCVPVQCIFSKIRAAVEQVQ